MIVLLIDCLPRVLGLVSGNLSTCVRAKLRRSQFLPRIKKFHRCYQMGECWVCDTFCYVGICRIKNYLMSEGNLTPWPEQFFSLHC